MFTMRISVPRNYQPRGRRYGNFNSHNRSAQPMNFNAGAGTQPAEGQNGEIRETVTKPQVA